MVQRVHLVVDGVMISPQRHALARQGDRNIRKTPLVIGTMLGITRFLNGSPSFNEAARMSGMDSIQRRQKMWRPKGCCNLSQRAMAASGQLRPATTYYGQLWLVAVTPQVFGFHKNCISFHKHMHHLSHHAIVNETCICNIRNYVCFIFGCL